MNYSTYTVSDFLKDEDFVGWVHAPSPQSDDYWRNWLKEYPDKRADMERAKELLLMLRFDVIMPTQEDYLEVRNLIELKINKLNDEPKKEGKWWIFYGGFQRVAASIAFLILCSIACFGLYKLTLVELSYRTEFGEIKSIDLPDGSKVILNANSEIVYSSGIFPIEKRKVNLKGEAFFSVKHTGSKQRFIVCTNEGNRVEVLGTEFNVTNRGTEDRVVLQSGSIRLHLKGNEGATPVMMKPGELVQILSNSEEYVKSEVDPAMYTSWRNRKFVFNDQSLRKILLQLEDLYGVALTVPDTTLLEQTFTGSVPSQNLEIILSALEQSLDVNLIRKQK